MPPLSSTASSATRGPRSDLFGPAVFGRKRCPNYILKQRTDLFDLFGPAPPAPAAEGRALSRGMLGWLAGRDLKR